MTAATATGGKRNGKARTPHARSRPRDGAKPATRRNGQGKGRRTGAPKRRLVAAIPALAKVKAVEAKLEKKLGKKLEAVEAKVEEVEAQVEAKVEAAREAFKKPVGAKPPWRSPWFILGFTLLSTALLGLGLLWTVDRVQALAVSVALGTMFVAGKEGSLPLVLLNFNGDPVLVGGWLIWVDVGASIMIYPFIAAAIAGVEKQRGPVWGFVGGVVRSTHRKAARKRKLLDKYGGVGLWLFSIVPFAFNGPPVGMTLGRIVGLRTRGIIAAIVSAIVATTVAWTVAWSLLIDHGVKELPVPSWIFAATAIVIMLVAVTFTFIEGRRERQRERAAASRTTDA